MYLYFSNSLVIIILKICLYKQQILPKIKETSEKNQLVERTLKSTQNSLFDRCKHWSSKNMGIDERQKRNECLGFPLGCLHQVIDHQ